MEFLDKLLDGLRKFNRKDEYDDIYKVDKEDEYVDDSRMQELRDTFQMQEKKLEELAKDRATLTNMLELQKSTLTNLLYEKTAEVEQLEKQINKLTVTKKMPDGEHGKHELNMAPMDIEGALDEVVPMIKQMSKKHQVGFMFQIDELENPVVMTDSLYVNAMILKMFSDAFECCEKRSKIIYYIRQKTQAEDGWAEYEYSCIYLGDSLTLDSEMVDALGGRITIDRARGGNVVTVRLKFKVCEDEDEDEEEISYGL